MDIDVPSLASLAIRLLIGVGPVLVGLLVIACLLPATRGRAAKREYQLAALGFRSRRSRWFEVMSGAAVLLAALVALTVSFSIEEEIRKGPSRALNALNPQGDQGTTWLLQAGTDHFMNTSTISPTDAETLRGGLADLGYGSTVVRSSLASLRHEERQHTGYVFAVRDEAQLTPVPLDGHRCSSSGGMPCKLGGRFDAIVDAGNGIDVGDKIVVRERDFTVIALASEPRSLINRLVVYVTPEAFEQLEPGGSAYAVVTNAPMDQAEQSAESVTKKLQVLSHDELIRLNDRFWTATGTAIMLVLISLTLMFATIAIYSMQTSDHEAEKATIGTLWALGVTPSRVTQVLLLRGLIRLLAVTVPSLVVAKVILAVAVDTLPGFEASLLTRHVLGALGLLFLATLAAALKLHRSTRHIGPADLF